MYEDMKKVVWTLLQRKSDPLVWARLEVLEREELGAGSATERRAPQR